VSRLSFCCSHLAVRRRVLAANTKGSRLPAEYLPAPKGPAANSRDSPTPDGPQGRCYTPFFAGTTREAALTIWCLWCPLVRPDNPAGTDPSAVFTRQVETT